MGEQKCHKWIDPAILHGYFFYSCVEKLKNNYFSFHPGIFPLKVVILVIFVGGMSNGETHHEILEHPRVNYGESKYNLKIHD